MKRWCSMAMSGLLAVAATGGAARADETEKRPWKATINAYLYVVPGGVFGSLDGLVPALRWTLSWWKLDLYSESEIVVDFGDGGDSFFYAWSELGFTPLDWMRFGAAIQRTRVVMTALDFQRGLFVSATIGFVTVALYEFNLGWATPTWVGAVSATF